MQNGDKTPLIMFWTSIAQQQNYLKIILTADWQAAAKINAKVKNNCELLKSERMYTRT